MLEFRGEIKSEKKKMLHSIYNHGATWSQLGSAVDREPKGLQVQTLMPSKTLRYKYEFGKEDTN